MGKYSTEVRNAFDTIYTKVFLAEHNDLQNVANILQTLRSVRKVNLSNGNSDLTVYSKNPFSAQETKEEVDKALEAYYSSSIISKSSIADTMSVRDSFTIGSKERMCYNDAISKIAEGRYDRNTVDDFRLALETYLKKVLGNNKPLEKQTSSLKEHYKRKGLANELIKLHTTSLTYLCDYFNNHAKHDYDVNKIDINTAVDYTNLIIKSLSNEN